MSVEWLPEEDRKRIHNIQAVFYGEYVPKYDSEFPEGNPKLRWDGRMLECQLHAVTTWLIDEDAIEARQFLAYAAEAGIKYVEELTAKLGSGRYYADDSEEAIEMAVLSGDWGLAKQSSSFMGTPEQFVTGYPATRAYVSAVKDVILGNDDTARAYLSQLVTVPRRQPYQHLGRLYAALLDEDRSSAEKGLKTFIGWCKKQLKPKYFAAYLDGKLVESNLIPFEAYVSIPGLTFCNIAARRGMRLEFDEPFLPKGLIAY